MGEALISAVWVSLYVSVSATFISAMCGIPLACWLDITDFRGKQVVMGALHSLLAVPTVVVGLLVYTALCWPTWSGRRVPPTSCSCDVWQIWG